MHERALYVLLEESRFLCPLLLAPMLMPALGLQFGAVLNSWLY
jgi:hypothetical protein